MPSSNSAHPPQIRADGEFAKGRRGSLWNAQRQPGKTWSEGKIRKEAGRRYVLRALGRVAVNAALGSERRIT